MVNNGSEKGSTSGGGTGGISKTGVYVIWGVVAVVVVALAYAAIFGGYGR
jgi:hypothetical protein